MAHPGVWARRTDVVDIRIRLLLSTKWLLSGQHKQRDYDGHSTVTPHVAAFAGKLYPLKGKVRFCQHCNVVRIRIAEYKRLFTIDYSAEEGSYKSIFISKCGLLLSSFYYHIHGLHSYVEYVCDNEEQTICIHSNVRQ